MEQEKESTNRAEKFGRLREDGRNGLECSEIMSDE